LLIFYFSQIRLKISRNSRQNMIGKFEESIIIREDLVLVQCARLNLAKSFFRLIELEK